MLGGGDENAFLLQAGGVTYLCHIAADGFDLKVVEINPAKDNPRACGRRHDPQMDRSATVQTNSLALCRYPNCLFKGQVTLYEQITPVSEVVLLYFYNSFVACKRLLLVAIKIQLRSGKKGIGEMRIVRN